MSQFISVRKSPIWKFVYTHNPFYLISAVFVLYGLHCAFRATATVPASYALAIGLAVYAAALAIVGWVVVRFGGVWDDARTILLTVLVVLLAMGVGFDHVSIQFPDVGRLILSASWLYAIALSELMMRGLRIRLPWSLRGPCYLVLALIFLYPIHVMDVVDVAAKWPPVAWAILAFVPLSALAILTFLPAAALLPRSGYDYRTPWSEPYFPWVLPLVLTATLVGRCYALSMSFVPLLGSTPTFQPYFLVLPLLAALCVAMQLARAFGRRDVELALLLAPVALVLLPLLNVYENANDPYLPLLVSNIASPLFMTLVCVAGFYVYARLRGLALAEAGVYVMLFLLALVPAQQVTFNAWLATQWPPFALAAALACAVALRRPGSLRLSFATAMILGSLCVAGSETRFMANWGFVPRQLAAAALLLFGALFRDRHAAALRMIGASALLAMCLASASGVEALTPFSQYAWHLVYELAIACLVLAQALWFTDVVTIVLALSCLALGTATASIPLMFELKRNYLRDGFEPLLAGATFFVLAVTISLAKAGLCRWLGQTYRRPGT